MSSRVQKGGTLFRPVVKQRRPASESPSKPGPSTSAPLHSSETPNTMPPPPSVPQRLETPALSLASEPQDPDDSQTRRSSVEPQRAIPNIVLSRVPTPITVGTSRKPATPISIGSRSSSIPAPSPTSNTIPTPSRSTNVHIPTEPHLRTPLPPRTTSDDPTRGLHTPPPEPHPPSTPLKKRPASAVEPGSGSASPPSKKARRSQRSATQKDALRKRISRRASISEPERSPGSTPEPDDDAETGMTPKPSRKSRRTNKSPIPYDPDQPGIELDPTVATMASICVDTGQGRVSSKANEIMKNHITWKAGNRERRAQMVAEMEAKKYGKALDSEVAPNPTPSTPINPPPPPEADGPAPVNEPTTGDNDFDYSQTMSASKFNVQVRIGPSGETVVDEESLYVDNSAEQYTHDYTHVEESDTTKFVNSATHSKKLRGSRWSAMETELFYDALSQFGENYELISYILPGRDRRACKNKFKAEDKRDPARINHCLKNRVPYDIQTLARMTGKDFSGPVPIIKAPTPLRMVEDDLPVQQKEGAPAVRKKSRTPGLQPVNNAEILGDVEDYEDND